MWNKPQLLIALADLILAAATAALLAAAAIWLARLPHFRLSEVTLRQPLIELRRPEIERALGAFLQGNFFSADIQGLRQALEALPWVRRAEVQRRWPSGLEINLEEHRPAALWGDSDGQLLNSEGEIFTATPSQELALPRLAGPPALAGELLATYQESSAILQPLGLKVQSLRMSPRLALAITLENGLLIELGRQRSQISFRSRMERFADHYPGALAALGRQPAAADMRYPNGFALRLATLPGAESKRKE